MPTQTALPTHTPYPTHTPLPTQTALPTHAPYPTYTPYPSLTPTSVLPVSNPSWRDPTAHNLQLVDSPETAREVLTNELKRSTRVAHLPNASERDFQAYLTYLSPQVIEAIVLDKAAREGLTLEESQQLIAEFDRRLQTQNAIPFLLLVRASYSRRSEVVTLGRLDSRIILVNQRHEEISPLAEYTSALVEPIDMNTGGMEGYVLFPRSLSAGCSPSVNLLDDHSFDIRLTVAYIRDCDPVFLSSDDCYTYEDLPVLWPYTLLPDIPLEEALDIPLPQRATAGIDASILFDILGLALDFLALW